MIFGYWTAKRCPQSLSRLCLAAGVMLEIRFRGRKFLLTHPSVGGSEVGRREGHTSRHLESHLLLYLNLGNTLIANAVRS